MYPELVLLFTIGCVGVFGQLEMSTVVPKDIPFNSTFKLDFELKTSNVIGESENKLISECGDSNTDNVCLTGRETVELLEVHVKTVPENNNGIKFTGTLNTQVKKYTLSTSTATGDHIQLAGNKIEETSLNIGFPVTMAKLFEDRPAKSVRASPACTVSKADDCVQGIIDGGFKITVDSATLRTISCTRANGNPVTFDVTPTGDSPNYVVTKTPIDTGFTPTECTVQAISKEDSTQIENKPNDCAAGQNGCFKNKVTSTTITVSSKPITNKLVISLEGAGKSLKATFLPIENSGVLRSINVAGIIGASWIITLQL